MTGHVEAAIARIGVPNANGDVLLPGCLTPGLVRISLIGHSVTHGGDRPVGFGEFTEEGEWIVFRGRYSMEDPRGRLGLKIVQQMGDRCQWSIGFFTLEWDIGRRDGQLVRLLERIRPWEVSPVLNGACRETHTRRIF